MENHGTKQDLENAPAPESFVYMLYSQGLIKIGFSTDFIARLDKLRAASAAPMTVIWLGLGTRLLEGELHKRFKSLRANGEWFRPGLDLRDYLHGRRMNGDRMTALERLEWAEANPTAILGPL